jgi:hypothetical protein
VNLANKEKQQADHEIDDSSQLVPHYLQQLNVLTIIRHISILAMEVQKHRGASMAVLEGDSAFEVHVQHEQKIIQRLLEIIQQINYQTGQVINSEEWQTIEQDWQALVQSWRNDSAITNFEFHSHFIQRLLKLIWGLCESAEYFTASQSRISSVENKVGDASLLYSEQNHHMLVQIALKLMPEMLENIAKLRGLATHSSVRGYCDSDTSTRFSGLLQSLNLNKERLRVVYRMLNHDALRAVPALPSIMLHEHRLDQLQQLISQKILVAGKISAKGLDVFDFATEIIEVYSQIISDSVIAFQRRLELAVIR